MKEKAKSYMEKMKPYVEKIKLLLIQFKRFLHSPFAGWLVIGSALLVVTIALGVSAKKLSHERKLKVIQAEVATPIQVERVASTANLGMLTDEVKPLDLKRKIVVISHRPAEYKGASFIKDNGSSWTIQIMEVLQEKVINNYLASRPDRDKFQYFRYNEENLPAKYILTYGLFKEASEAVRASEQVDFSLPQSIQVFPKRVSLYKPFVTSEDESNAAASETVYGVKLRQVSLPKPKSTQSQAEKKESKTAKVWRSWRNTNNTKNSSSSSNASSGSSSSETKASESDNSTENEQSDTTDRKVEILRNQLSHGY